jgi:hypothetical protein
VGYEFVFVAVAFGIATGLVGKSKGGSFLLWFVIGTVLPGFGLAAAILTRNEQKEPERQCPACGHIVKLYVQICPRCGAELYLPDVSEVRMPPPKRRWTEED